MSNDNSGELLQKDEITAKTAPTALRADNETVVDTTEKQETENPSDAERENSIDSAKDCPKSEIRSIKKPEEEDLQKQQQQQVPPRRRSSRRLDSNNKDNIVVAPGFGTKRDIERLARELSIGNPYTLPTEAVLAIMSAKGNGISNRRSSRGGNSDDAGTTTTGGSAANSATPVSSAWADFMMEEGVGGAGGGSSPAATDSASTGKRGRRKSSEPAAEAAAASSKAGKSGQSRQYDLPIVETMKHSIAKKSKKDEDPMESSRLVQTGTLDSALVGRSKGGMDMDAAHTLFTPTVLSDVETFTNVYTAGHACHSLALDGASGKIYGWGRNEAHQLGSSVKDDDSSGAGLRENVYAPTELDLPCSDGARVRMAACGKSHTIVLMEDGTAYAAGSNLVGQCGICKPTATTESILNFRECVFPAEMTSTIVKVACGEDFSMALCDDGYLYSCGSSQYGKLGNGETGERLVKANKIEFSNCGTFTKRTEFHHAPNENTYSNGDKNVKVVKLSEDVRLQDISCGKNHTVAVEADCTDGTTPPRAFTWGCGNYGVLGHGVQKDEYYPRLVGSLANVHLPAKGTGEFSVAAGQNCSLLKTVHGHAYYWGKHRSMGEATMRPTLVDALANNGHIVTQAGAGGQTVVCCTANAVTVAWGQGPHGELGLGPSKKSSSKPDFVPALDSCRIASLACGYGHTLFIVRNDDKDDKIAVKKLPVLEENAVDVLEETAAKATSK